MLEDDDEVRWELGEAVMSSNGFVPGLFVFVYAGVIGWKHTARGVRRCWVRFRPVNRLRLPPPLLSLPPPADKAHGLRDR